MVRKNVGKNNERSEHKNLQHNGNPLVRSQKKLPIRPYIPTAQPRPISALKLYNGADLFRRSKPMPKTPF